VVRIGSGETGRVELDLRAPRGCAVELDVTAEGRPVPGCTVRLTGGYYSGVPCRIGPADERGHLGGWSSAFGNLRGEVWSAGGLPLGRFALPDAVEIGAVVARQVVLRAGTLTVAWPEGVVVQRLQLVGSERRRAVDPFRVVLSPTEETRLELGPIAPGEYELSARLYTTRGLKSIHRRVEVEPGAAVELAFPATDPPQ
jgi:hypothetical protein